MAETMAGELIVLLERDRLCLDCLSERMRRSPDDVARGLEELSATVRLSQHPALCSGCAAVRISYRVQ